MGIGCLGWGLLAAVLCGVWLLVTGLRLRRVGDDPHCRACGYNLVGSPDSRSCPECGAALDGPMAIRRGELHRQPVRISVGALILLVIAALTVGAWWANLQKFNWYTVKPVWLLAHDLKSQHTHASAARELNRRFQAGRLSQSDIDRITRVILARQADTTTRWQSTTWGEMIELYYARGLVSDADWSRYVRQSAAGVTLRLRPRVRRGGPMPIFLGVEARGGNGPHSPFRLDAAIDDIQVDGKSILTPQGREHFSRMTFNGAITHFPMPDMLNLDALAEGEHEWTIMVTRKAIDAKQPSQFIDCGRLRLTARLTLLAADQPAVTPFRDESQRPAVQAALSHNDINIEWARSPVHGLTPRTYLTIRVQRPPVPLAFATHIRQGDNEWEGVALNFEAGATSGWSCTVSMPGLKNAPIDIVLRPSVLAAERSLTLTRYWDGEVVFKDVKINMPPPPAPPLSATSAPLTP